MTTDKTRQYVKVTLTPDMFDVTNQGNLVVSTDKIAEALDKLKEHANATQINYDDDNGGTSVEVGIDPDPPGGDPGQPGVSVGVGVDV